MIKQRAAALPALQLLTASLLSSCGSVSTPVGSSAQSLPSDFKYLHTLSIASTVSEADLQQRYGGKVIAYWPEEGRAIIASNNAVLGSSSNLAKAVNWAVSTGAQIINISAVSNVDTTLTTALSAAANQGIYVTMASGNEASDKMPYPAINSVQPDTFGQYALNVGALNSDMTLASFTNYGLRQKPGDQRTGGGLDRGSAGRLRPGERHLVCRPGPRRYVGPGTGREIPEQPERQARATNRRHRKRPEGGQPQVQPGQAW